MSGLFQYGALTTNSLINGEFWVPFDCWVPITRIFDTLNCMAANTRVDKRQEENLCLFSVMEGQWSDMVKQFRLHRDDIEQRWRTTIPATKARRGQKIFNSNFLTLDWETCVASANTYLLILEKEKDYNLVSILVDEASRFFQHEAEFKKLSTLG